MLTIPVAEESKPRRVQLGAQQQQELQDSGSESAADQNANEQPVSADSA
jgi:hypothetical protein